MTDYRIWPATNGPSTDAADNSAYSMGAEFYVTDTAWIKAIHYYRGTTSVTPVVTGGIFTVIGSGLVSGTTVTFSNPGVSTGWLTGTLATPVELTPGNHYKAVVEYPNNYTATGNYWSVGAGVGGLTNGLLVAPDAGQATGGGQDTFKSSATLDYPDQTFNGGNYWVDLTVTDTEPVAEVTSHMDVQGELNRLAHTFGLGEAGAANVYAGTADLETVGALNVKAGVTNPLNYTDLQGAANALAGTTGLGTPEALSRIPTP